jgi:threonine aldolase
VEPPETNLVFFDTTATGQTADALAARLRQDGISVSTAGPFRLRACTHLDVTAADIDVALQAIRRAV